MSTTKETTTPELLTLAEVGKITRTAPRTVARWTAGGRLPVVRIGRRVLVTRRALDAFIETSTETATSGPLAGRNL